jgi:diacylglycerol kinase
LPDGEPTQKAVKHGLDILLQEGYVQVVNTAIEGNLDGMESRVHQAVQGDDNTGGAVLLVLVLRSEMIRLALLVEAKDAALNCFRSG